jgi:hypothetical protein
MKFQLLFSLSLVSSLAFCQNFCGTISLAITKGGQTGPAKMFVCGDDFLVRYNLQSKEGNTTTDFIGNLATKKSYLRTNVGGSDYTMEVKDSDISGAVEVANTTLTGEKKVVNGFNCELLKVLGADGSLTEAWISNISGLDFGRFSKFLKEDAASAALVKMGLKAVPIKATTKDKNGFENYSFQITVIEAGRVEKSTFDVVLTNAQTK